MKLSIYSLRKIIFHGEVKSLTCPTTSGEITVLDHHRPLITVLKNGVIKIDDLKDKDSYIELRSGFLEVGRSNSARLIIEQ